MLLVCCYLPIDITTLILGKNLDLKARYIPNVVVSNLVKC